MKSITITIHTDAPNADGIAHTEAAHLFERFSRKPRFTTTVTFTAREGVEDDAPMSMVNRWDQRGK